MRPHRWRVLSLRSATTGFVPGRAAQRDAELLEDLRSAAIAEVMRPRTISRSIRSRKIALITMIAAASKAKNAVQSFARSPTLNGTSGALLRFGGFLPVGALETVVESLQAYAQYFGSAGFIAAGKLEGLDDQFTL